MMTRHSMPVSLRCLVLAITAVVCGCKVLDLGFYNDDFYLFWLLGDRPHPEIVLTGRVPTYFLWWAMYDQDHLGFSALYHVMVLMLHLLVINELLSLMVTIGLRPLSAATGVLVFAVFPVCYEAYYWIPGLIYPLACFLILFGLRLFCLHLERGKFWLLVVACISYFAACTTVEFVWMFCIFFGALEWHLHFARTGRLPAFKPASFWRGGLFGLVAVAAAIVYMYFNRLAWDRLSSQGGFASPSQLPSNVLVMLRSTITWPKRFLLRLFNDSLHDLWIYPASSLWLYLAIVATLVGLLFVFWMGNVSRTQPAGELSPPLGFATLIGLLFLFAPGIMLATVVPHFRSRIYYIPAIGIGVLVSVAIEALARYGKRKPWGHALFRSISYITMAYIFLMASVHYSIQSAFATGWITQQRIYRELSQSLVEVEPRIRLLLVGKPELAATQLQLYQLNELRDLDSALSLEKKIRRPQRVDACNVLISVMEDPDSHATTLRFNRPRGQPEGEVSISQLKSHTNLVMVGFEGGKLVSYDRIRLWNNNTRKSTRFQLACAEKLHLPRATLTVRY